MKFLRVQCISYSLSAAARIVTVLKQFSTPQFNAARCFLFALQSIIAVLKLWKSMKKLSRQKTEREGGGVLRIVTAILLAHISSNGAFGWECGRWHYLILIQFQTEKTPHTLSDVQCQFLWKGTQERDASSHRSAQATRRRVPLNKNWHCTFALQQVRVPFCQEQSYHSRRFS